jgi:type II secretion system protein N
MYKQYEISKKYLFLLLLYGILAFLAFLIILFPKEKAAHHVLQKISEQLHYSFSFKNLLISFPGQLELKDLTVTSKMTDSDPVPLLQIDKIQVRPKLSQLFSKKICLLFRFHLYRGLLHGRINFDLLQPRLISDFQCVANKIQLSDLKQIQQSCNIHFTGNLSGEARLELTQNDFLHGTGEYAFTISEGEAQIMSFPSFTFQQIDGEGSLAQGKMKIRLMRIQSDELQAQVHGDLRLNQDVMKSYLNARAQLNLSQKLRERLGPLANFLPRPNKEGIRINMKGSLDRLSFLPI